MKSSVAQSEAIQTKPNRFQGELTDDFKLITWIECSSVNDGAD